MKCLVWNSIGFILQYWRSLVKLYPKEFKKLNINILVVWFKFNLSICFICSKMMQIESIYKNYETPCIYDWKLSINYHIILHNQTVNFCRLFVREVWYLMWSILGLLNEWYSTIHDVYIEFPPPLMNKLELKVKIYSTLIYDQVERGLPIQYK